MPEITGETANGRSMNVISRFLPANENFAMAQAAAMPKTRLSGTAIPAASKVSRMAASASGVTNSLPYAAHPFASASAKTEASGNTRNNPMNARATTVRLQRTSGDSVVAAVMGRGAMPGWAVPATVVISLSPRRLAATQPLKHVDSEQQRERRHQHYHRDRGGAGIVELLQLGHDEQGCDLGLHRHVAGDEHHRSVLAYRPRKGQRKACENCRPQHGEEHLPENLSSGGAQAGRRFLDVRV